MAQKNKSYSNEIARTTSESKFEINKIFSTRNKRKEVETTGDSNSKRKSLKTKKLDVKRIGRVNEDPLSKAKPVRYTSDGLPVYKLEDLNIGIGGNTPDCPFDCKCCY